MVAKTRRKGPDGGGCVGNDRAKMRGDNQTKTGAENRWRLECVAEFARTHRGEIAVHTTVPLERVMARDTQDSRHMCFC